jgi:acyl-CoA reductase-like NAD-dependent aldehyde dehydrogenase
MEGSKMKMIINGEKIGFEGREELIVTNPADGTVIDSVPKATSADLDQAIEAAQIGTRVWRTVPLFERIGILNRFGDLVLEKTDEIGTVMCRETGKTLASCIQEVKDCVHIFRVYCEKARNFGGETLPQDSEARVNGDIIFTLRQPIGVVGCIIPFNYPLELYAHKVAPALTMGNAVIIKPASDTPLSAIMVTELLLKAGVPAGAAQIVTGSGSKIGTKLAQSPGVDAVSLTGSVSAGVSLVENGAKTLKNTYLELGGNDPLIVFEDADLDAAVEEALLGRASNAGQTCCGTKRFLVQNGVKELFVSKLQAALEKLTVGDPMNPETDYGPLISESAAIEVEEQVNETIRQGAKLVCGGKRFNKTFFEPTILTDVTKDMNIATDMEVFGPVFPVIGFDTEKEALEIANTAPYGLSSGVMTKKMDVALRIATKIEAGTCVINGCGNYRSAHMAFGGPKMTGLGREGASYTLTEYTRIKNIALKQMLKEEDQR